MSGLRFAILLTSNKGTNQIVESYSYNAQTGLLDNQTVARGGTTLLNLSYDYGGANGRRTGQLTKILNNLNHNKDREKRKKGGQACDSAILADLVSATSAKSV